MKEIIIRSILNNAKNIPGWSTNKKIVVFESDDWGAIRMPSVEVYNKFIQKGFAVNKGLYNRYDSLETDSDLINLFDVLSTVKDKNDNPVVFTANCIVANPDFNKIKQSGFKEYFYEPVNNTFKKYPQRGNVFALWKEGMSKRLFHLQSHGREHVNINRWMTQLQKADINTLYCFDHETTFSGNGTEDYNYMEALDFNSSAEITELQNIVKDGLLLFNQLLGFHSKSFIAPSYIWDSGIEPALVTNKVKFLQGLYYQYSPLGKFGSYKKKIHYIGQTNKNGLTYLIRNCSFEPTLSPGTDAVDKCLAQIKTSFRWRKPAFITTHRVNYVGSLDQSNRDNNLHSLKKLLQAIKMNWPDVEFMTSDQVGELILN